MTRRDMLLAATVATAWGFNFVVIDWGMDGIPPLLFLAVRFTLVLLPAVFFVPRPQGPWRTILAVGTFMALGQFAFLYLAMAAGLQPGLAALILQAQVVFTIAIAAVVLRERPTRAQLIGVAIAVVGLVVVGVGRGGNAPVLAVLLCLAGALSWGVGNVISRRSGITGGLSLTVWSALAVPVPALALSLLVDGPDGIAAGIGAFGWEAALSSLYTAGVASLVGYGIFTGLLSRNPSAAVVPWVLLAPVVAMISAWLLLHQRPSAGELAGGALLVTGVLVAQRVGASRSGASRSAAVRSRGTSTPPPAASPPPPAAEHLPAPR